MAERGVAGAEVVERGGDADRAQADQHVDACARRRPSRCPRRPRARAGRAGSDAARSSRSTSDGQAEVEQVGGPEVDGDAEVAAARRRRADLLQRAVEHERGQRARRARSARPAAGSARARAGRAAGAPSARAPRRRARARCAARPWAGSAGRARRPRAPPRELADQREPLAAVAVARRQVDLVAGAHALGLVHRDVGALQQPERVARRGSGKSAMPTLASMCTRMPPTANELLERGAQPQPGGAGRRLVAGLEHDRELVAAEPRERVVVAQQLLQPRADLAQHLVAGVVAERVVELLEAVEVDQQQRELVAVRAARLDRRVRACRRRWRRLPSPVRSSVIACVAACRAGARSRSAPARAMPVEHGDRGERDRDRLDARRTARRVSSASAIAAKARSAASTTGLNSGPAAAARSRQPGGGAERDRGRPARSPRAGGQRDEPERARAATARPGRQRHSAQPGDAAAPIAAAASLGAERHGERGGGRGAHRRVEPRQPADRPAANQARASRRRWWPARRRRPRPAPPRPPARPRRRLPARGRARSRARHGPPGDDRARARDGPRHEEGARD